MKIAPPVPPSSPPKASRKGDNTSLDSIAGQIQAVEKKSIANIVETGRLLELAFDRCERGTFETWLESNLGWSVRTARRYRDAFKFSKTAKLAELGNLTTSAFHLLVSLPSGSKQAARIRGAAITGRVTYSVAMALIEEVDAELEPPIEPLPDDPPPESELSLPEPEPEPPRHADGDADGDADDANSDGDDVGDDSDDDDVHADIDIEDDDETPSAQEPVKASPPDDGILTILLRRLHTVLRDRTAEAGIKLAIVEMGSVQIHEIVERLKAALNEHSSANATKAIADRIEAKSRTASTSDLPDIPACLDRRKLN